MPRARRKLAGLEVVFTLLGREISEVPACSLLEPGTHVRFGVPEDRLRIRRISGRVPSAAAVGLVLVAGSCGGRTALDVTEAPATDGTEGGAIDLDAGDGASATTAPFGPPDAADDGVEPALGGSMVDASADDRASLDEAAGDAIDDAGGFWCGDVRAVPECVEYQDFLSKCLMMREEEFACQATLLPTDDADVQAIQRLCLENLQRLQAACR